MFRTCLGSRELSILSATSTFSSKVTALDRMSRRFSIDISTSLLQSLLEAKDIFSLLPAVPKVYSPLDGVL